MQRLFWAPGRGHTAIAGTRQSSVCGRIGICRIRSEQGVLQGLYKFRFTTERGAGCGVMFATSGGRLYGGDSGSSFVGRFTEADGIVSCEVTMSRHYHDPAYVPMFEVERAVMNFTGAARGDEIHFEG